jgi:hypothetical protein
LASPFARTCCDGRLLGIPSAGEGSTRRTPRRLPAPRTSGRHPRRDGGSGADIEASMSLGAALGFLKASPAAAALVAAPWCTSSLMCRGQWRRYWARIGNASAPTETQVRPMHGTGAPWTTGAHAETARMLANEYTSGARGRSRHWISSLERLAQCLPAPAQGLR